MSQACVQQSVAQKVKEIILFGVVFCRFWQGYWGFLTLVDAIATEGLKIKQRRVQTGGRGALWLMTGK